MKKIVNKCSCGGDLIEGYINGPLFIEGQPIMGRNLMKVGSWPQKSHNVFATACEKCGEVNLSIVKNSY